MGTWRAVPLVVLGRQCLRAAVVVLACMFGRPSHASGSFPLVRAETTSPNHPLPDRPLDDLRRATQAVGTALRRRVPDWSPEADASRGRVDSILSDVLDYEEIARGALGTSWNKLNKAQQREFLEKFSALTNQVFVEAVTRPGIHLRFDSEAVTGTGVSVFVTAWASESVPHSEQNMEFRLMRKRDRWLVYDVLVDNVSLADEYRDQFARIMHRGGFPEVIARMQHKLEVSSRY
jgi:phospholipid transport system substrate-binding protein